LGYTPLTAKPRVADFAPSVPSPIRNNRGQVWLERGKGAENCGTQIFRPRGVYGGRRLEFIPVLHSSDEAHP